MQGVLHPPPGGSSCRAFPLSVHGFICSQALGTRGTVSLSYLLVYLSSCPYYYYRSGLELYPDFLLRLLPGVICFFWVEWSSSRFDCWTTPAMRFLCWFLIQCRYQKYPTCNLCCDPTTIAAKILGTNRSYNISNFLSWLSVKGSPTSKDSSN